VIDLHSHILPGLDDGVQTVEESVELARVAAASGIEAIAGTPHVRDDWPTTPEAMEAALGVVRAAVEAAGVAIRVLPGGELALPELGRREPEELRRFGLGGNPAYLLVETPYYGWPLDVEERFFQLRTLGITGVLAHPERNGEVQADPARIARLVHAGALVQVTAASLDGRAGRRARATGLQLIEEGLAHVVASDAHAPAIRRAGLDGVAPALGDAELADWLTRGVPAAIVAGTELPPRPERTRRKKRFGLF
jgi:protein-tyrosine phosphatase